MASVGFTTADFAVFEIEGFSQRMAQLYARVRPKLLRLGDELSPVLSRRLHMEFFPHVAKHARRTVNPPPETWCAFGPSPKGYKRYPYLGLCISGAGLHARVVVKSEADKRPEMAGAIKRNSEELVNSLRDTPIARYDNWDCRTLPDPVALRSPLCGQLSDALDKKTGGIDLGFGWPIGDALRLSREELCDAFNELEPLYRLCRSVT